MGLNQRQAVLIMYLISAISEVFCYISHANKQPKFILLLAVIVVIIMVAAWKCGFFKH